MQGIYHTLISVSRRNRKSDYIKLASRIIYYIIDSHYTTSRHAICYPPPTNYQREQVKNKASNSFWNVEDWDSKSITVYVFTNFLQSESNITVLTDVQKKKKKRNHYVYLILTCKRQEWHAPSPWIRHGRRERQEKW